MICPFNHRDGNHRNNPADGSNWENLCVYCHDAEHSRDTDAQYLAGTSTAKEPSAPATHNPFGDLKDLLNKGGED